jgi:hypothetical protein
MAGKDSSDFLDDSDFHAILHAIASPASPCGYVQLSAMEGVAIRRSFTWSALHRERQRIVSTIFPSTIRLDISNWLKARKNASLK